MSDTPTIFVAFGVTGDLMRLRILPALFALYTKGDLPERFALLGVSRRAWSNADLRTFVGEALTSEDTDASMLAHFLQSTFFIQGDVQDAALYAALTESFEVLENTWGGVADKLLYLSLSPTLYRGVFEQLRHAPFTQDNKRVRLMLEKPFGTSGASAEKLQSILQNTFDERALYRVDHYLAKEDLQKLPATDGTLVSQIHISFFETDGVEKRGAFYDATGALLDIGQNHMLEVLARIIMEHSRGEALEALRPLSPNEVPTNTSRAQYDGYKKSTGVAPDSSTETYFKITSTIDTPRFPAVRFTLEGGKRMAETKKEIRITYKDGRVITHPIGGNKHRSEYEALIYDCICGNQTRFVTRREVAALWRFIDPVIEGWKNNVVPLQTYPQGTNPSAVQ